jgi:hypothetical protein
MISFVVAATPESNHAAGKSRSLKPQAVDELNAPNVLKTKTHFRFNEVIISFLNKKNLSSLVFDLILDRDTTMPSKPQEEDVPLVIDTLISDLFPTINLFWTKKTDKLQHSLQHRINRILTAKFNWITGVKVLNIRIQDSEDN